MPAPGQHPPPSNSEVARATGCQIGRRQLAEPFFRAASASQRRFRGDNRSRAWSPIGFPIGEIQIARLAGRSVHDPPENRRPPRNRRSLADHWKWSRNWPDRVDALLLDQRRGRIGDNGRRRRTRSRRRAARANPRCWPLGPVRRRTMAVTRCSSISTPPFRPRSTGCRPRQRTGFRWSPTDHCSRLNRTGSNSLVRRQVASPRSDAIDQFDQRRRCRPCADSHRVAAQRSLEIEKRHVRMESGLTTPELRIVSVVRSRCSRSARRISNSAQRIGRNLPRHFQFDLDAADRQTAAGHDHHAARIADRVGLGRRPKQQDRPPPFGRPERQMGVGQLERPLFESPVEVEFHHVAALGRADRSLQTWDKFRSPCRLEATTSTPGRAASLSRRRTRHSPHWRPLGRRARTVAPGPVAGRDAFGRPLARGSDRGWPAAPSLQQLADRRSNYLPQSRPARESRSAGAVRAFGLASDGGGVVGACTGRWRRFRTLLPGCPSPATPWLGAARRGDGTPVEAESCAGSCRLPIAGRRFGRKRRRRPNVDVLVAPPRSTPAPRAAPARASAVAREIDSPAEADARS